MKNMTHYGHLEAIERNRKFIDWQGINILHTNHYSDISQKLRTVSKATGRYEELRLQLNADEFMLIAQKQSGLTDFGSDDFILPLHKLLDSVAGDVNFSEQGLAGFKGHIVQCLINKLRIRDDLIRHPEILQEDVSDPIVVIGMPRTGTTKMQRILSSLPDTEVQKPYLWRMLNPAPFPNAVPGEPDPRIAAAASGLSSDDNPDFAAAHKTTALEPDEDGLLCDATFDDWVWSSVFSPSINYYEWVMPRPHLSNYQHLRTMYQYLQWQDGGRRGRPWVSKNVQHIMYMEELLTCFPKATIVHCHRSPHQSIPSLVKLSLAMWTMVSDEQNPQFAGQAMLWWWQKAMSTYLQTRDRLGLDERIIDLQYEDIRNSAVSIVDDVYRRSGRALSAEQLQFAQDWDNSNEQHQHGKHAYSLEEFGLDTEQIDRGFADYIQRFIQ